MIISTKIRLKPTKEQEVLFWKSCGVARWSYNFFLAESERHYNEYIDGKQTSKSIKETDVRKYINNTLKKTTHAWLGEVGSNVMKQGVKDADLARKRWFNGLSERPRFKSKHKTKPSFYVNYENLKRVNGGFRGEKIGFVKTTNSLPKVKGKYSNPRISFDGFNWYLSIGYEKDFVKQELTNVSLGIDVGIKELAVCSSGKFYKNINKTKRVKFLERKLKREQIKLSRKIEANIKSYTKNRKPVYIKPLKEMNNIQKQNKIIRKLHKQLSDIRSNHLHQSTSEIVKTKPYRIVMETLNIKGMMKNRHLSKAIAKQCLYEFKRQIQYKCQKYGIAFVEADKWYPSSKTCSCCGTIKKDLKLSDRVFKCQCGFTLDRDLNASINLANY